MESTTSARVKTEYELSTDKLKRVLKAQKISYVELASGIGMSESGLKKVLNASDGSLQRLVDICAFVGISLQELFEEKETDIVDVRFTAAHEELFLRSPQSFALFWLLTYERETVDVAKERLKFSDKETFQLLRELDKVELLQLLPNNRVRIPSVRAIRWRGDGPFLRKIYKEFALKFVEEVANPEERAGKLFQFRYFRMTEATQRDFLAALRGLESDFLRRAIREMQSGAAGLRHVRWLSAVDDKSFF